MGWPVDHDKLERVRSLMADQELDVIVARAPDNVLYLSNYWCMKGYDTIVFPREGEATLAVIEPQLEEAGRTAWTDDLRPFASYHPGDPRPPAVRATEVAAEAIRSLGGLGRVGLELSQGTQASDRMVGEPTVFTRSYFEAFDDLAGEVVDASSLLAEARAIKSDQELKRMRLANELAALGVEHVREQIRPGMKESEVGALFEGHVHSVGVGYHGAVEMARAFTLVWSGPGIATFTATGDRPVQANEPTLMEIWVCADGYWTDLTKNVCPGELAAEYDDLLELLLGVFDRAVERCRPGASLAELDASVRRDLAEAGYPGQPSHPIAHGVGARAHEPPWPHQAGAGEAREGMVLAIEPGVYWDGGGGLRLEDNFLVTRNGAEKLCSVPEDFRR